MSNCTNHYDSDIYHIYDYHSTHSMPPMPLCLCGLCLLYRRNCHLNLGFKLLRHVVIFMKNITHLNSQPQRNRFR